MKSYVFNFLIKKLVCLLFCKQYSKSDFNYNLNLNQSRITIYLNNIYNCDDIIDSNNKFYNKEKSFLYLNNTLYASFKSYSEIENYIYLEFLLTLYKITLSFIIVVILFLLIEQNKKYKKYKYSRI